MLAMRTLPIGVPAEVRTSLASCSVLGQPRPDLGGYAVAQLGQYNAATGTLEQSPSAFTLKFDDLPADMRLRRAIGHSHLAEAAQLGSVREELPGRVVHECLLLCLYYYI